MFTLNSIQLYTWLGEFFWPFFRIMALLSVAPIFGSRGIPASVKILTALFVTIVIAPVIPQTPNVAPASAEGLLIVIQQVVIGLSMGMAVRMVFSAMEMAGHIIGLQMGLGFATFFDPQNATQVPLMGQFVSIFATLLFLAFNGHLMIISALSESFYTLPIGQAMADASFKGLVVSGGMIFVWGVQLALPVMAAIMLVNVALGVLTRAAPQLNIFAVGFPLTLGVGFIILALSIPYFPPVFHQMIEASIATMLNMATPGS